MRRSTVLTVAMVASEAVPYSKSGGLADVAGALPTQLAACPMLLSTTATHAPKTLRHCTSPALPTVPQAPPLSQPT